MDTTVKLKKAPAYRFVVLALMTLSYLIVYWGMQMVSSCSSEIMAAFGIEMGKLSFLFAIGTLVMGLFPMIGSGLIKKIGGKNSMLIGLAIISISGFLYLSNPKTYGLFAAYRILQGCGCGFVAGVSMGIVNVWFPPKERSLAQAFYGSMFGVAVVLVTVYANAMANLGKEWSFTMGIGLAIGAAVLFVLILIFYKDIQKVYGVKIIDDVIEGLEPVSPKLSDAPVEERNYTRASTLKEMLRFPGIWMCCAGVFCFNATANGFTFLCRMFLTVTI